MAASLSAVTRDVFGKRGLADGAIVKDWPTIAGDQMARYSQPEKIVYPRGEKAGGTLHLTIANGSMAVELQHLEPLLVERINGYFGYGAIERLKITQGPLPEPDEKADNPVRSLEPGEEADLAESLMDVEDEALRDALQALGRAVIGRQDN